MILKEIIIPTPVARPGMTVREVLELCVTAGVPGIPFSDTLGLITGRISIRHVFRQACVPKDLIEAAHLLGDEIDHLNIPEVGARKLLAMPAEQFLLENIPTLSSVSAVIKAVAIMEKYNSSYLFVMDDGDYKGVVTRFNIAKLLLKHGAEPA